MLDPNVLVIGIPHKILDGIATALLAKLHVNKREFTALPTGVTVLKTEILAVVTVGNVPVANPKMLLIWELDVDKVICGVLETVGNVGKPAGAVYPDGREVGASSAIS